MDDEARPVSDGGTLYRLANTPDGGLRAEVWEEGAWRPAATGISDLWYMSWATPEELKAAGVPDDTDTN